MTSHKPPTARFPEPPALIAEGAIRARVASLAARIDHDYRGCDELLLVGVLRGAFIFLADLSRRLAIANHVDFIALSSYQGTEQTGAVRLIMDLRTDLAGKHVLIVEDIVDTGHTLDYLLRTLAARGPASLRSCSLLRKRERHEIDVHVDYVGFDVPDVWVIGYGLDYDDRWRTLPYIGVLEPEMLERVAQRPDPATSAG
ncbi:MAG: hypoxanthine phosphoribosyltransferase [Caldilineae bacterium]|nr:hypoxanthine phosphoribosyltransferase [Chloroflexota bacterium]MCB9177426.1 hypoxanthine phosphoribosyltransferase [Caldilineae bacterium]